MKYKLIQGKKREKWSREQGGNKASEMKTKWEQEKGCKAEP